MTDSQNKAIIFGLAGPLGTDLDLVINELRNSLTEYTYMSTNIRLSELLQPKNGEKLGREGLMSAGDDLRSMYKRGDAVAAMAIKVINQYKATEPKPERVAWILRTLKHGDEVTLLRSVYGQRFVLIGVQEDKEKRTRNVSGILKDEGVSDDSIDADAVRLIARDEKDHNNVNGQQGQDVYAQADYFINISSRETLKKSISNLVSLLFGDPYVTPTRDEVAMFHAFGASLRSSDAGRQVGAVITLKSGEIITTGSNEVPKFGGGEYWRDDDPDGRDFAEGYDFNKRQISRNLREIVDEFARAGVLETSLSDLNSNERIGQIIDKANKLKDTRVLSLIEYGRVVHAEMSALTQAARLGVSTKGATLYSTAFPCHMCMRLIISAGIERVVYVDPYPKSLALEMYADSVTSQTELNVQKVKLEMFSGASWRLYPTVFMSSNRKRSAEGKILNFDKQKANFTLQKFDFSASYEQRELDAFAFLSNDEPE